MQSTQFSLHNFFFFFRKRSCIFTINELFLRILVIEFDIIYFMNAFCGLFQGTVTSEGLKTKNA